MPIVDSKIELAPSESSMPKKIELRIPVPDELSVGITEIIKAFPQRFTTDSSHWKLEFRRQVNERPSFRLSVESQNLLRIEYSQPASAFRALGILMGCLASGDIPSPLIQTSLFKSVGTMVDVSRNGVLRICAVQKLIRHCALMGINQMMFYTEDTFEIPGEPMFGYFRGGYSQDELRSIDQYAALFGIELIPCIQTLGHLEQVLQWPCYHHLKDTDGVLLAGDQETEAFIEKMISAASAPFRSNRIHIGMDEAHGIGSGNYRLRNGLRPPFEILCEHLQKIVATCKRLNLKPMIWSDMFFRLGSKTNSYYDQEATIFPSASELIPEDVQLVYWDYYHTDAEFYSEWIDRHRQMGKSPIFAGGIWTWNRFWAQLPHSQATLKAGISAAQQKGLDEVLVTFWGDDGMECDIFSALPAIQYFADLAYGNNHSADDSLSANFLGSVGGTASEWIAASELDLVPSANSPTHEANVSKWILWHDPLLGHYECQIQPEFLEHYQDVAARLENKTPETHEDARLLFIRQLAIVLALKTELHLKLRPTYKGNDREALQFIHEDLLRDLRGAVCDLRSQHEVRWHEHFRCFGWEVIEKRYAALISRLDTLAKKLSLYLSDQANVIPELECQPQQVWPMQDTQSVTLLHRQASTPSFLS